MLAYTLYDIETRIIKQSGLCPDETCLPDKPADCEFEFGVVGDPETELLKHAANGSVNLVKYVRDREPDELIVAIERERAKRLSVGFDYDFGDMRGVHRIGTTADDEKGWDKVTKLSQAMINAGRFEAEIQIVTDTGPVTVTAAEWQLVLIKAGEMQQPIYQRSFMLQSMQPIPQDVENPENWT